MPLCARCAGMYVGLFAGLPLSLLLVRLGKSLRRRPLYVLVAASAALWGADGIGNLLDCLHTPNAGRFALGMLLGLSLSPLIVRMFAREAGAEAAEGPGGGFMAPAIAAAAAGGGLLNVYPARALLVAESVAAFAGLVMFLATIHAGVVLAVSRNVRTRAAFAIAGATASAQMLFLSSMRGFLGV